MVMFQNERKRAQTRGWPIIGFCGANGGGKSAAMVWATLPSLAAGRPVLSTVRLLDYENPRECDGCDEPGHFRAIHGPVMDGGPETDLERDHLGFPPREVLGFEVHKAAHRMYVPFTDWEQLLEAKSCDVLMDEVTGVASSRESQAMPSPVANKLVQLRRNDVIVRWSAPSWARADKIIRECSQAVVYCRGFLPRSVPGTDRMWRQRRMFFWKTYDASEFEDFTSGKRESMKALMAELHWGPRSPVFQAYDTFDSVSTIGTVTDSGRCYRCGGRREIPRCSCAPASGGAATPSRREPAGNGRRPSRAEPLTVPVGPGIEPSGSKDATPTPLGLPAAWVD